MDDSVQPEGIGYSTSREAEIERLFASEAERYDAGYEAPTKGGRVLRMRMAAAVRLVGEGPGSVVDVGMGSGRLCVELANRGWTVSGLDLTQAMVELARQRLPAASERLTVGHAESLAFGDGAFDAVVSIGTLEYVSDLARALEEIARVLRPGGLAVISFPHFQALPAFLRHALIYPLARALKRLVPIGRPAPVRRRRIGRRPLERLFAAAELQPEALEYIGPWTRPPTPLRERVLAWQLMLVARKAPAPPSRPTSAASAR